KRQLSDPGAAFFICTLERNLQNSECALEHLPAALPARDDRYLLTPPVWNSLNLYSAVFRYEAEQPCRVLPIVEGMVFLFSLMQQQAYRLPCRESSWLRPGKYHLLKRATNSHRAFHHQSWNDRR